MPFTVEPEEFLADDSEAKPAGKFTVSPEDFLKQPEPKQAKFQFSVSPEDFLSQQDSPAAVPGMERLGGNPPGPAKPPIAIPKPRVKSPAELAGAGMAGSAGAPPEMIGPISEGPIEVGAGVENIAKAKNLRQAAAGGAQAISGAFQTLAPMVPASAAAAPIATAATLALGSAADYLTQKGLDALGVPKEYSGLAGAVAALLAGGKFGHEALSKLHESMGSPEVKFGKFEEPKPFHEMTDEELLAHANAIEKDPPKNYQWQKEQIVQEAAKRQAERGMGQAPAAPAKAAGQLPAPMGPPEAAGPPEAPKATVQTAPIEVTIEPGNTYETANGKAAITKVIGNTVVFDLTRPDGSVAKGVRRPMRIFQALTVKPVTTPVEEESTQVATPPGAEAPTETPATSEAPPVEQTGQAPPSTPPVPEVVPPEPAQSEVTPAPALEAVPPVPAESEVVQPQPEAVAEQPGGTPQPEPESIAPQQPAGSEPPAAPVGEPAPTPTKHEYASTQANIPLESGGEEILAHALKIPQTDLIGKGVEDQPHVTIRYGNDEADHQRIAEALKDEGPITVKVKGISMFPGVETKEGKADVLKLDIDSEDLRRLNEKIGKAVPHPGETFKDYKPHITLAYVKQGTGKKYVGKAIPGITGKSITLNTVQFSGKDDKQVDIPLKPSTTTSPAAAPVKAKEEIAGKPSETIAKNGDTVVFDSPQGPQKGTVVARYESDGSFQVRIPATSPGVKARSVFVKPGEIRKVNATDVAAKAESKPEPKTHQFMNQTDFKGFMDRLEKGDTLKYPGGMAKVEEAHRLTIRPLGSNGPAETQTVSIKLRHQDGGIHEYRPDQLKDLALNGAKKPVTPQIVPQKPVVPEAKPDIAAAAGISSKDLDAAVDAALGEMMGKPEEKPTPLSVKVGETVKFKNKNGEVRTGKVLRFAPQAPTSGTGPKVHVRDKATGEDHSLLESLVTPASEPSPSRNPLDKARESAKARLREKYKGTTLNSGIDPQDLIDLSTIGAANIIDGAVKFNDWRKKIMADMGDLIKAIAKNAEITDDDCCRQVYPISSRAAAKYGAQAEPLPPAEESPTIKAGEVNAGTESGPESVRPEGGKPLEEQLSEGNAGAGEGGGTSASSGEGSPVRQPRKRTSKGKGPGVEPGGGTISGVVGNPAKPEQTFPPRAQDVVSTHHDRDYRIPDGRVVSGSPEARARINIEAIKTLRQIQEENRPATLQEQDILAGYVGWGAVPQLFAGANPEFQKLQSDLKNLLTEEEYSDAQRSTTNAHYTGDLVVDAMWKAVQTLGAKPGMSWLEPAVGVGNFFGRQPQELLPGARRVGLDKDSLSGQIAKLLYPDSGIDVKAFEEAELPKDYFDGSISNVPFGNFGVHDPEFRGKSFITGSIHNYFFAKALQSVRPGGVVAFVTSRYTMDAYAPAAVNFRKWIAERAHLIGAVRLPSGAFRQNAGTDVITDIIFLRKKLPTEDKALGHSWVNSEGKTVKSGSQYGYPTTIPINEYYHKNPENILGEESTTRGQFTANDYDVKGVPKPEKIQAAIEGFPKIGFEDYTPTTKRIMAVRDLGDAADKSKLGGLFFDDKGKLFRKRTKGAAEPIDATGGVKARIRSQLGIRDALLKLTTAELADKPETELTKLRKDLNRVYDTFTKANGPLSSLANAGVMKGDPDAPLLLSLERRYTKGNKSKGIAASVEKAPIFERRMLKPPKVPDSVGDPKEALYISLNEKGRLDWDRMADLTGRTPEQLQEDLAGLVYQDPHTKIWQTSEEYLSGSVRIKLKQARAIAKMEPKYAGNVEALEKVQPTDIAPGDIRALLGVTWVPIDRYSEFAAEMLGADKPEQTKVKYAGGNWIVETGWGNRLDNAQKWSTARVSAAELLSDTLNMRRTKVYDRDSDGTTTINSAETKAARARQMEMQDHFEKWLFADSKRGDELVRIYNDTQNDLRLRTFDGSHLTLPGMTKDSVVVRGGDLEPHQKAGVWRQIVQPNVLLAHAVGTGKTFEMIAGGMELQRLGLIKRPMYVVPNATLTSWQDQFAALYPQKRVLVFSEKDLERSKRMQIMAQIATGDWDAVVVPHSSFQFLPTGDEIFNEHFQKLSSDLEESIMEAQEAGMDTRQIKRMEKSKERLLTSLKDRRNAEKKDQTVTWEQLGIDQLFVDESHEYKKLGFSTKQGNVAGIDQDGNQKTFDLQMKLRYTQKYGRGVVFATGTPVTNTMGELYSIMRYLIEPEMEARGIGKFDEWSANFGRTVDVFEPKIEGGGYQLKARFAQFVNLPELAQLFRSFADVVTSDMVDIPRPELIGGKRLAVETQLTDAQAEYLEDVLRARAKNIRQDPRGAMPDNMLAVYTDAQKMALDLRMVDPTAADDPHGRLNQAADLIHQYWEESKAVKGAQVVFSDLGKPAEAGGSKEFSVYDELIKKLVDRGIPRHEIAHIYQAKNKTQRAKLFQDVNDGKIRVLMGSTMKMGVGVNVQRKLYALHHLDVPHRPSDLEQREGRILRQGNENPAVHVRYYVTKGSLDESKFANVVRKAKFINQVMQGKSEVREAEDVGGMVPSLEMFQAMASGDPRVMRKMEVDAEVDRLSGVFSGWKNQQYKIRAELAQIPGRRQWATRAIDILKHDIGVREKVGPVWKIGKESFSGDKISKDVSDAITKQMAKIIDEKDAGQVVGTAYGLPVVISAPHGDKGLVKIEVGGEIGFSMNTEDATKANMYLRIRNVVDDMEEKVASKQEVLKRIDKEEAGLKSAQQDVWPYAKQFQDVVAEQQRLVKELGVNNGDDAAAGVGENGEIVDKTVQAQEPEAEEDTEDDEEGPDDEGPSPKGLIKGETGTAPVEPLSVAVRNLKPLAASVSKDVLQAVAKANAGFKAAKDDLLKLFAPAAREGSQETALSIRQHAAEMAREVAIADHAMLRARKAFSRMPIDQRWAFYDRIEHGDPERNPELSAIAGVFRQILDGDRTAVQKLGTGKLENFIENYLPHIYKDTKKAEKMFASYYAKRPMEGKKSFLKQRKYEYLSDAMEDGLEPVSDNPVDMVMLKHIELQKYVTAHRILQDMKDAGIAKYVKAGERAPEGFSRIDDKIATVFGPKQGAVQLPEDALNAGMAPEEVKVFGSRIMGQYWAPEPAARVINNYLSPGLSGSPIFRGYRILANAMNQFQLGVSAFHLGFTTVDAATSKLALGIYQAAHGQPVKGLLSALGTPIAPFTGIVRGDKMLKEYFRPGSQGEHIGNLVDAMILAGGRGQMDSFYRNNTTRMMLDSFRAATEPGRSVMTRIAKAAGGTARVPAAFIEQTSRPILEWIVPRQKLAIFADLAEFELSRLKPGEDPQPALAKAWDSVDNRMGQLVYDNLFWNKVFKDMLMASTRSVGWNTGTIREILGGAADIDKMLPRRENGKTTFTPDMSARLSYLIALPVAVGLVGAVMYYLWHGEAPKKLEDYYMVPDNKGHKWWLPSYMKDIISVERHGAFKVAQGKIHPLLSLIGQMLSNRDYFDKPIRNTDDSLVKQVRQEADFVSEQFKPIALRPPSGKAAQEKRSTQEKVLPEVGITRVPAGVINPEGRRGTFHPANERIPYGK